MNREGYKTPTEDKAVANETRREKLRRKYRIREGDVVQMVIDVKQDAESARTATRKAKVRVKEIHTHLVTVSLPSGLLESFQWWDFERRRR